MLLFGLQKSRACSRPLNIWQTKFYNDNAPKHLGWKKEDNTKAWPNIKKKKNPFTANFTEFWNTTPIKGNYINGCKSKAFNFICFYCWTNQPVNKSTPFRYSQNTNLNIPSLFQSHAIHPPKRTLRMRFTNVDQKKILDLKYPTDSFTTL